MAMNISPSALDELEWRESAACLPYPAILFFGVDDNESATERRSREEEAKAICAECVVRADCLEYALEMREPYGIWGGLTELERKARLRGRAN
ncbi:MAG: WhiB family transcriptional regulator [Actinomycetota bacterium]|nr:WhiB family transcriptional regulator [Actinomycetota bacterium]